MNYHLADFYDVDEETPTEDMEDLVRDAITIYDANTSIPLSEIYLVGGLVREDTTYEGRKDVDVAFVPLEPMDDHEQDRLYWMITNHLQQTFGENYEVFVGPLDETRDENIELTSHFI
jgi:predicted nucleotidyltransferase